MKHGRPDYQRIQDPAADQELIDAFIAAYDWHARSALPNPENARLLGLLENWFRPITDNPPTNPIGKDEPVFLLRASDQLAPFIIREYGRILRQRGAAVNLWQQVQSVIAVAEDMEQWQLAHGAKLPDTPEPAAT